MNGIFYYMTTFLLILLCWSVPTTTSSQMPAKLRQYTLNDCIHVALSYSPSFKAATFTKLAQRSRIQAAKANMYQPLMSIQAQASFKYQDLQYKAPASTPGMPTITLLPDTTDTDFVTQPQIISFLGLNSSIFSSLVDVNSLQEMMVKTYNPFASQVTFQIAKPIFTGYALKNQIELEKVKYAISDLQLEKLKNELIKKVMEAFYTVLLLNEVVEVTKTSLSISKEALNGMEYNYSEGLIDRLTFLRFRMSYRQALPNLESAENNLKMAKQSLLILMGKTDLLNNPDTFTQVAFIGSFQQEPFTWVYSDVEQKMRTQRNEIRQLDQQREQAEVAKELLQSKYYPTASLFGSASYTTQNHFQEERNTFGYVITGGLQVSFSLTDLFFPKSNTRSSIQEVEYQIHAIHETKHQLTDYFTIEIRNYLDKLEEAKKNITIRKELETDAQEIFEIAKKKLSEGLIPYIDYREIEILYIQAKLALVQELHTYTIALLNLKYAMNEPLYAP